MDAIDRSARQQARLIEDILDVSRIVSGKLRLDTQPVDLTGVINSALDTVRAAAEAKGIRIYPVLSYDEGLVLGDPMRLQQVVWNLLSNSIKFTPKNGSVSITLARIDSHFDIVVSDSGPGIGEDFLPYLFERFRQADSSVSRNFGGLGLGLSIVKHIVELHGVTVTAANREEGSGAMFIVRLPVMAVRHRHGIVPDERSRGAQEATGDMSDCPPELDGIKVLIVDDEADARLMLSTFLEHCGAEVSTCGSADEALDLLKASPPDVLVSDIGMPGQDGYTLIQKVRASESVTGSRVPAIALTAYARTEDRMRAIGSGYNMHVPKPVEPAELALVIASLTGNYRRR